MSEYVKNKKDMKFQNLDALKTVESVLNEVDEAVKDKERNIKTSAIPEALVGVAGLSAAGVTSGLAATSAVIGGVAGFTVLAAPVVILGVIGVGVASHHKYKELRNIKMISYKEALKKQTVLIQALLKEREADKERIEYLNALNTLLQATIKDLKYDLGIA